MRTTYRQSGSALISMVIVLPFLMLICALFVELAVNIIHVARKDQAQTHAQLAVDAGIDYALQQINQTADWTSTGGEVQLHDAQNTRTTFEVALTEDTSARRVLSAVGRTYRPSGSTTPISTKRITAELRPVTSKGFSVVTGVGGLFMTNSAKIVGGDVLVNGEIVMDNTTQIGLSTNPVKVEVAHQNCPVPADATYPKLCNSGENGQPITIADTAHIYGSVKANNQTTTANMSDPGLVGSSGVAAQALPVHDRAAQIGAVATTITAADASCDAVGAVKSWPANVKITGDVTIGKNCKVTLNGNVWITGKLTLMNTGQLIVGDTLTTTMPDVMIDGTNVSLLNSSSLVGNTSGTGMRVLTYHSLATCSPDCTSVTGSDLYNSRNVETITMSNTASAPESIFYARWTQVNISNSGGVGALIGQTVKLSNSATITFGSAAATGSTFWVLDGYRRTF